jgi:hypothetical protein
MGILIRIGGLKLGSSRGASVPAAIKAKFLFWGKVSDISGGQMPNKVTGATDHLDVTGSPATYVCPNTAPYIAADHDHDSIWFKTDETPRTTTTAELIGYDFARTLVKYDNATPYTIREIIILKDGETLTTAEMNFMRDYMDLSTWWDDTLSLFGNLKGNRSGEQSHWTAESISPYTAIYAAMTNKPTAGITAAQQTLVDTLVTGGVWAKLDRFFMFAQYSNTAGEALLDWVDPTRSAVNLGAPTFASLEGFTGVPGVTNAIKSGFTPTVGTNKFLLNDSSFGFYQRRDKINPYSEIDIGSSISGTGVFDCAIYSRYTGDVILVKHNDVAGWDSAANADARGLFISSRLSATEFTLYKNKVGTLFTRNSAAIVNMEFHILAGINNAGAIAETSRSQLSMAFFGGGLTQANVDCLTDAFEVYMDFNGKGII